MFRKRQPVDKLAIARAALHAGEEQQAQEQRQPLTSRTHDGAPVPARELYRSADGPVEKQVPAKPVASATDTEALQSKLATDEDAILAEELAFKASNSPQLDDRPVPPISPAQRRKNSKPEKQKQQRRGLTRRHGLLLVTASVMAIVIAGGTALNGVIKWDKALNDLFNMFSGETEQTTQVNNAPATASLSPEPEVSSPAPTAVTALPEPEKTAGDNCLAGQLQLTVMQEQRDGRAAPGTKGFIDAVSFLRMMNECKFNNANLTFNWFPKSYPDIFENKPGAVVLVQFVNESPFYQLLTPPAWSVAQKEAVISSAAAPQEEKEEEEGLANRSVRTVAVRPDGSVVTEDDLFPGAAPTSERPALRNATDGCVEQAIKSRGDQAYDDIKKTGQDPYGQIFEFTDENFATAIATCTTEHGGIAPIFYAEVKGSAYKMFEKGQYRIHLANRSVKSVTVRPDGTIVPANEAELAENAVIPSTELPATGEPTITSEFYESAKPADAVEQTMGTVPLPRRDPRIVTGINLPRIDPRGYGWAKPDATAGASAPVNLLN